MRFSALPLAFAVLALLGVSPVLAQEPFREEETFLRVRIDQRDVRLEAFIVKPAELTGRLPLALITHGQSPSSLSMGTLTASRYANVARDLARRGWLAAVVLRRGAGQSDSRPPIETGTCEALDFNPLFSSDGAELEAAMQTLQKRDDVDPTRAIALGESAGGAGVIALAHRKPEGLRGIVNIAGGRYRETCLDQSRVALVKAIGGLARKDAPPQLWVYAQNDAFFTPEVVDRMRTTARDAGADIRSVELPEIKPDGHLIFRNGVARLIWLREMDTSLRAWKLPTWPLETVRTHRTRLGLTGSIDTFERYFAAPGEKAMALSPSKKQFGYWFGADSMDAAKEGALRSCTRNAADCVIAFENDRAMPLP